MIKNKIRNGIYLYPMPVVIIGANVGGKANFMPIAWVQIIEHHPPMIQISASQSHYTNKGIKENGTFSVNLPCEEMVEITDFCGLNSGVDTDKSELFELFYGDLKTAPMIMEAPVNLECKLIKVVDLGFGHEIFMGEIIGAYAEEKNLTNGIPDVKKFKPIIFTMNDNNYWKIGDHIGRAWSIGKKFKKK